MRRCCWLACLLVAPGRAWLPQLAPRPRAARRAAPPRAVAGLERPEGLAASGPPAPQLAKSETVGILLLNLGGPNTLDDVEPFLYNLFSDPEIITLPDFLGWLKDPIAKLISSSRAPVSSKGYEETFERWLDYEESPGMGDRSMRNSAPQLATTQRQGEALEAALAKRGVDAKYYIAMRYWYPYTQDALDALKADGIQKVVMLPLYPQFSIATSGSSLRELERAFYSDQTLRQVRNVVIPAWYNRPGYIEALVGLISAKCELSVDKPGGKDRPHVFFSAHGLPSKYLTDLADPYKSQMESTVAMVMARMRQLGYANNHTLAYQSKVGPVEWVKPYTDDRIRELAAEGCDSLVVVPIAFVSEHIETLEEIDGEYQELAREAGITTWERVPALACDETFIDDLAEAVIEVLPRIEAPPISVINEGRPVSLRVVNDLVQLRSKEEAIEYGPVKYDGKVRRVGLTPKAELINGRIAMAAITVASIYSYFDGTLLATIQDGRMPYTNWLG